MRRVMLAVAMVSLFGCGGVSQEQYGASQAEATKYKKALQDESGKVAALEAKTKTLEGENAALKAQAGELQAKLTETASAKSELEVTTAKLSEQSGQYAKMNEDLQGRLTLKLSDQLLFNENSSKLSAENKRALDAIADAIRQVSDKSIVVVGYTDSVEGGKDATVKRWQLSSARALEVAKYLAGRGVDAKKIGVAGFGEGRAAAPNDTLANRALNRRVEIALTPQNVQIGTVEVKPATLKK